MFARYRLGLLALALAGTVLWLGGCGRSAAWSPTGDALALDVDGKLQRFEVATGAFTPLETGGRYGMSPSFSPDGKQLAYYTVGEGTAKACDLWTRDLGEAPGAARKVAGNVASLTSETTPQAAAEVRALLVAAWSPDGRKLAFTRVTGDRGAIQIVDLNSGAVTSLGREGESQIMPAWSPDGDRLAYLAETPGARMAEPRLAYDLFVAAPDAQSTPERIWDGGKQGELWPFWPPTWTGDGRGVAVLRQERAGPGFELCVALPGGTSEVLTRIDSPQATVTPELDAVVYMGGEQNGSVIYKRAPFRTERVLDRIAGETRKERAPFEIPAVPLYPVLSADGTRVALPLVNGHREVRLYEIESGRKTVFPIP